MDSTDRKILSILKEDSRQQFAQIGKLVNLSAPAVFARVRKMEQQGVIQKFGIQIRPESLNLSMCAFIRIVVKGSTAQTIKHLEKYKAIEEAHHVAGEDCLILKVRAAGSTGLNELLEKIKAVEGIERTVTSVVLQSAFERGTNVAEE